MLNREQQREILAVGLLALALFLLLSLVPVSFLGPRADVWVPSGNAMGVVGATVGTLLFAFLGHSALLVPVLLFLGGLWSWGWLSPGRSLRLAILTTGLMVLLPLGSWIVSSNPAVAGWLGVRIGAPVVALLDRPGGMLTTSALLVVLSVATLGWNPLRSVGKGIALGGGAAGRTARGLVERSKAAAEARAQAAREAALAKSSEPLEDTPLVEEVVEPEAPRPADAPSGTAEPPTKRRRGRKDAAQNEGSEVTVASHPPEPRAEVGAVLPSLELLTLPEERDLRGMERQLDELGKILVEKLGTFNV
jgi:hypothetical protein